MVWRPTERHAARRLAERASSATFDGLRAAVDAGRFEFVERQTCTRSLCRAHVGGEDVYFVLNRRTRSIVTVLDAAQAALHIGASAR